MPAARPWAPAGDHCPTRDAILWQFASAASIDDLPAITAENCSVHWSPTSWNSGMPTDWTPGRPGPLRRARVVDRGGLDRVEGRLRERGGGLLVLRDARTSICACPAGSPPTRRRSSSGLLQRTAVRSPTRCTSMPGPPCSTMPGWRAPTTRAIRTRSSARPGRGRSRSCLHGAVVGLEQAGGDGRVVPHRDRCRSGTAPGTGCSSRRRRGSGPRPWTRST